MMSFCVYISQLLMSFRARKVEQKPQLVREYGEVINME